MVRKFAALLLILGLLAPGMASALGLGGLSLKSYLNEPLRAEIDLLEVGGLNSGQVKIRLATREDFNRAGVERAYFLTSLKFEVEMDRRDRGILRVSSELPVQEPYLDFLIEVRWPNGRLLREYTVLLDLPVFSGPQSSITNAAVAPGSDSGSVVRNEPSTATASDAAADATTPRDSREYASEAETQPIAGAEYLVQKNETLWGIASRARPSGTTVQQTMLDIQRLNPNAFINNNINQLKAGYVLRLPASGDISEADAGAAAEAVAAQTESWQENRDGAIDSRALDKPAPSTPALETETVTEGRLQIAGVEEPDTADSVGLEGEVTANLEKLDRAQRDNADLQARLDAMDEQLVTVRRLLSLKDDQIAALQASIAAGGEGDDGEAVSGTIGDPDAGEGDDTAVDTTPEPSPQAAAPVTPAVEPEEDIFSSWLTYILFGALLLLVAVAYVFRGRFTQASSVAAEARVAETSEADDEFAGVELGDDGLIVDEISELAIAEETPPAKLEPTGAQDDDVYAAQFESGDALAEADIYIAYGRYPQAVDLLKTAIGIDPQNTAFRVKLLEVCVEMVERGEFQQQYADIQALGDAGALRRGQELVEGVDGGELWLQDLPPPSIAPEHVVSSGSAGITESTADAEIDLVLDEDLELEMDQAELLAEDAVVGEDDIAVDLELDGTATDDAGSRSEAPAADSLMEEALEDDSAGLDPIPDMDAFDMQQFSLEDSSLEVSELLEEDLGDIPELELDDFEVEGDDTGAADSGDQTALTESSGEELLTEFGELEIEDSSSESSEAKTNSEEELVFAAEGDEIATKLDLARAYLDMDDHEGARSILKEVALGGNEAQKQEAEDLLQGID